MPEFTKQYQGTGRERSDAELLMNLNAYDQGLHFKPQPGTTAMSGPSRNNTDELEERMRTGAFA